MAFLHEGTEANIETRYQFVQGVIGELKETPNHKDVNKRIFMAENLF